MTFYADCLQRKVLSSLQEKSTSVFMRKLCPQLNLQTYIIVTFALNPLDFGGLDLIFNVNTGRIMLNLGLAAVTVSCVPNYTIVFLE